MPQHRSAVRAAAEAGVQRVVYSSFMGAAPLATFPFAREHWLTEQLIAESGLRLTALRNALYADVVPHFVGADGVIRGPAGQGKIAWVARHDVARLAVEALLDPAHAERVCDVSGPDPIDLATSARLLSAATGREIRYVAETDEQARASRAGAQEWQLAGWAGSYRAIATGGLGDQPHRRARDRAPAVDLRGILAQQAGGLAAPVAMSHPHSGRGTSRGDRSVDARPRTAD